jgi:hypothetical protein
MSENDMIPFMVSLFKKFNLQRHKHASARRGAARPSSAQTFDAGERDWMVRTLPVSLPAHSSQVNQCNKAKKMKSLRVL